MRTMYDAVNVGAIPSTAKMVAGYEDGHYQTIHALEVRFPHEPPVVITVLGGTAYSAQVADIETGDLTPPHGVTWAKNKQASGHGQGSLYCNLSTLPAVLDQIDAQHASRSTPIWTAHPTGRAHLCGSACFAAEGLKLPFQPNIVATQYAWPSHGSPGDYDLSLVVDHWPGVDPPGISLPWWWHRPLRVGMTGLDVLACKRRLHRLGYRGLAFTPKFGNGLLAAVQMLQRQRRLNPTGVVDGATAHAIRISR